MNCYVKMSSSYSRKSMKCEYPAIHTTQLHFYMKLIVSFSFAVCFFSVFCVLLLPFHFNPLQMSLCQYMYVVFWSLIPFAEAEQVE